MSTAISGIPGSMTFKSYSGQVKTFHGLFNVLPYGVQYRKHRLARWKFICDRSNVIACDLEYK